MSDTSKTPPTTTFAFLLYIFKPFRKRFILFFLCTAVALTSFTAAPFIIRNLINHLVEEQVVDTFIWVCIGLFVLLRFMDEWFWRIGEWIVLNFLPELHESVRTTLFRATMRKEHNFFVNANSGQIGFWINDAADKVRSVVEATVWSIWNRSFTFLVTSIFLAIASWKLALLFLVWIIALTAVLIIRGKQQARLAEIDSEAGSVVSGRIVDAMANSLPVRVFDAHEYEVAALKGPQSAYIRKWRRQWKYGWYTNMFKGNSAAVVSAFALIMVVWMYANGEVRIGDIALFVTYLTSAGETIWDLSFSLNTYIRDYGALKNAITNLLHPADERRAGIELQADKLRVSLQNVDFAYPDQPAQPVLSDLSFTIKEGERVGVVGHSGAGKSTLVSLLLGLHEPTGGRFLYNDQDVTELSLASVRRVCGYVPQDTSLFNRTIRENILYGMPHIDDKTLYAAAERAQAHGFIQNLPNGYDSLVGERGVKLSGGQRQRIAIARAMLSAAPFIILDEATSALDSMSEQHIQKALSEVMKGRTALVIAHRLSTLKHLDRIIVLDKGRVAEEGTHDQLLKRGGIYADLWRRQKDGFLGE